MLREFNEALSGSWETEPSTDTQYSTRVVGEKIIISFQGSKSFVDWLQNFVFWKAPYKGMHIKFRAHAGFVRKYKSVRDRILQAASGAKEIEILGSSQGAAIASLCHEDMWYHYREVATIRTWAFSSPRVFSWFKTKELKKRLEGLTRVVNGNDIVPTIPPWIFMYKHYGEYIHIGKPRWHRLSIRDHLPENVRESVKEYDRAQGLGFWSKKN